MKVNVQGQIAASYANAFNSFLQLEILLFSLKFHPICVLKQIVPSFRKKR